MSAPVNCLHLVADDLDAPRRSALTLLLESDSRQAAQRVVHLGRAAADLRLPVAVAHVPTPTRLTFLAARRLRGLLTQLPSNASGSPSTRLHELSSSALATREAASAARGGVLMAWTPACLEAAFACAAELRSVAISADLCDDLRTLSRWYAVRPETARITCVVPSSLARRRVLEAGVAPHSVVTIRTSVDFGALRTDRSAARAQLGLREGQFAWLALPPIARDSGAELCAWATILVDKINAHARLILPHAGASDRVERFVAAAGQRPMLIRPGPAVPLATLLAAADGALLLPKGDQPVDGLAHAMAAGVPIVASATPANCELLLHAQTALLTRPTPRDAARRMLELMEDGRATALRASLARAHAYEWFSRQRGLEQYRRLIDNLGAGRAADDGIVDPLAAESGAVHELAGD